MKLFDIRRVLIGERDRARARAERAELVVIKLREIDAECIAADTAMTLADALTEAQRRAEEASR